MPTTEYARPVTDPTTAAAPVTARSTLGVPFIPPATLSDGSSGLRNRLGAIHRRMAPPPLQILESTLSLLEHRVLVALCDAGVPEALVAPTTIDALADQLGVDPDRLDRLTRYGATKGWLRIDRSARVHPTTTTDFLRKDHPAGWRAWVEFAAGEHVHNAVAVLSLDHDPRTYESVNGKPFFDWLDEHPTEWATFDAAMAAGARMHALMLDAALNWHDTLTICDVGGGTGELARTLLDRHPDWKGTVLDLPAVIHRAVQHPRLTALAGDAFVAVPPDHDTYLLVNVLHDWSDDDAVRLLSNVAAACDQNANLVIVEGIRRRVPRDDVAQRADILMAALTSGGRERTAAHFTTLIERSGLSVDSSHRLGSGDLAITCTAGTRR
jgi:O-methyltransferase domain